MIAAGPISRALRYFAENGEERRVAQADLLHLPPPIVVLGEPGSGKSTLLQALADQSGLTFTTAKQFLRRNSVDVRDTLIIDALDEVATARETDAVQRVLQQLHALGNPPFLLSCRSAEWPGAAAASEIKADYGRKPAIVSLDPFDRDDAKAFLQSALVAGGADELLDHLLERSLTSLYENPLTLQLLADIANRNEDLPDNRGELFATACDLLWSERAVAHEGSALGQLTQDQALLSAGAAAGAQLLTGADAVTMRGAAFAEVGDLQVGMVEQLPHGGPARAILRSRLFVPARGDQRFAPLHRVIAEYLGARWLARLIEDGVPVRRVVAMIVLNRTVPSSLRGLHAWLAFFSEAAVEQVLQNDPYGVLRYGDVSTLPTGRLRRLLAALEALAQDDPYFRAEDWGRMSSRALARPDLAGDIASILSGNGNFHLRKLLLETIAGTPTVDALVGPLRTIVEDTRAVYAERYDAAEALQPVLPGADWLAIVERLRANPSGDNGRLAIDMLGLGDPATSSDRDIAMTIAAFLGYTGRTGDGSDGGGDEKERRPIGTMSGLARRIPDARLAGILDALCEEIAIPAEEDDWERRWELAYFAARGIWRALQHGPAAPARVWRWLQLLDDRHGRGRDDYKRLDAFIAEADDLRNELQQHALFVDRGEKSLWMRSFRLGDKLDSLAVSKKDAVRFLEDFGERPHPTDQDQEDWQDLVTLARIKEGLSPEARAAARKYAKGKPEALAFLRKASRPASDAWERKAERRRATVARNREKGWEKHRADFAENRDALRAGELRWIVPPARAYLALFHDSDRDKQPIERLAEWLGPDLANDASVGFEAVLGRDDLPAPEEVSASYVDGRRWNMVYPMVAGVAERLRGNGSTIGVSRSVLRTVWIAAQHESYLAEHAALDDLVGTLERRLDDGPGALTEDYRMLLEPQFAAGSKHPSGLYRLMREVSLAGIATGLTVDWLGRFPTLPTIVEVELVDHLLDRGRGDVLRNLWQSRLDGTLDAERRLLWIATAFIVDFDRARPMLDRESTTVGNMLFGIRNRLRRQDRTGALHGLAPDQLGWLVATFRSRHRSVSRPNRVTSGDSNPWDATDFLRQVITLLEADTSIRASDVLIELRDFAADDYSDLIRHAAAGQRRARDEADYEPIAAETLLHVAANGPPGSIDDLQAVMLDVLAQVRAELRASETNPLDAFYAAPRLPKGENYCRDRIVEWLRRALPPGVVTSTETRMPADKRSDIAFSCGEALIPVEIKPQWNPKLWDAAIDQLDALYAKEWRAKGRGIYLVLWFGQTDDSKHALRPPPDGAPVPDTPAALAAALTERIPEARRGQLNVVVLDLER